MTIGFRPHETTGITIITLTGNANGVRYAAPENHHTASIQDATLPNIDHVLWAIIQRMNSGVRKDTFFFEKYLDRKKTFSTSRLQLYFFHITQFDASRRILIHSTLRVRDSAMC